MKSLNRLVEEYYSWLKDKTTVELDDLTGWTAINTPFIGLFNDSIEIYAKKISDKIILSDDSETLNNLELSGISISRSAKRKEILYSILDNYGVTCKEDGELLIEAEESDFVQKKHNLISAITEIYDLNMLAKHTISSIFKEDVREYLESQEIIYTPQFISRGASGLEFTFDFQIAYKSKEIVVKSFNTINKNNLPNFLFTWNDIREPREKVTNKKVIGLAVINNIEKEIKHEYLAALKSNGAEYILWEDRYNKDNILKLAS